MVMRVKTERHVAVNQSQQLVANLIETAGANRMIALDLHAPQIQGFFDIPIDHLMGVPILLNTLKMTQISIQKSV